MRSRLVIEKILTDADPSLIIDIPFGSWGGISVHHTGSTGAGGASAAVLSFHASNDDGVTWSTIGLKKHDTGAYITSIAALGMGYLEVAPFQKFKITKAAGADLHASICAVE